MDIDVTQDLGQTNIKKTRDILVKFKPKLIGYTKSGYLHLGNFIKHF